MRNTLKSGLYVSMVAAILLLLSGCQSAAPVSSQSPPEDGHSVVSELTPTPPSPLAVVQPLATATAQDAKAANTHCGMFTSFSQSEQVTAVAAMMRAHGLATDDSEVQITLGSTRAFCNVMGPDAAIEGIYG